MQETRTILLYEGCLEDLQSQETDRLELLQSELEDNDEIKSMIGCYHDSGQVTYNIIDLHIDEKGKGSLEVNYIAHKYSGCRDIDLDEEGDMTITIQVDLETGVAILIGENWPDREPDDY